MYNILLTDSVSVNNILFTESVSVYNILSKGSIKSLQYDEQYYTVVSNDLLYRVILYYSK